MAKCYLEIEFKAGNIMRNNLTAVLLVWFLTLTPMGVMAQIIFSEKRLEIVQDEDGYRTKNAEEFYNDGIKYYYGKG